MMPVHPGVSSRRRLESEIYGSRRGRYVLRGGKQTEPQTPGSVFRLRWRTRGKSVSMMGLKPFGGAFLNQGAVFYDMKEGAKYVNKAIRYGVEKGFEIRVWGFRVLFRYARNPGRQQSCTGTLTTF